jgi:hypothetical protein
MFDLARDVVAGAYRGNPHLPPLPGRGRQRGGQDMDARDKRGQATARRFDLIGTRSKARSRQVLGD